jgi:hypothetical protein
MFLAYYQCFIIMSYEDVVWSHISVDELVFMQILQAFGSSRCYSYPFFPTEGFAAVFCSISANVSLGLDFPLLQ